jgi:hypothetical protein
MLDSVIVRPAASSRSTGNLPMGQIASNSAKIDEERIERNVVLVEGDEYLLTKLKLKHYLISRLMITAGS